MENNKRFIFIIGAPRSGTSWLQHLLSAHYDVASVNKELNIFWRYINPMVNNYELEVEANNKGEPGGIPVIWERKKFDEEILNFIFNIYNSIPSSNGQQVIIDKCPTYSFCTELIHYYLPEAKFIHIIRDGRDVAYSFSQLRKQQSHFDSSCILWKSYKDSAKKASQYGPSHYLEIHYDTLFNNTSTELQKILRFCQLPFDEATIEGMIKKNIGQDNMVSKPDTAISYMLRKEGIQLWKIRLSKENLYVSKRIIGKDLIEEGYEKDYSWGLSRFDTFLFSTLVSYKHIKRTFRFYLSKLKMLINRELKYN